MSARQATRRAVLSAAAAAASIPPAVATTPSCPAAAAAARAAVALAGMDAAWPHDRERYDAFDMMLQKARESAADAPARSVAGALFHVLIAVDEANLWFANAPSPEADWDTLTVIRRCVASAADVLREAGVQCDPRVLEYFRSPHIDVYAEEPK